MSLEDLVRRNRIEPVAVDPDAAEVELEQARKHLESAELLVESDPVMAYAALYDAARKSITAHMRARGYRVKGLASYHAKTFEYAAEALAERLSPEELERLDDMRSTRNDSEYRSRHVGAAEVRFDLATARAAVLAVSADL